MSRVIRAALLGEEPFPISVPQPPEPEPEPEVEPEIEPGEISGDADEGETDIPAGPIIDPELEKAYLAEMENNRAETKRLLEEARVQSAATVADAQNQKEQLLSEARAKAESDAAELMEKTRAEAQEAGYKDGFEQGTNEAKAAQKKALDDAVAQAAKILADARAAELTFLDDAEEKIVDMVVHIAEKILPQHFIDVPQVILPLVRKAILKIKDQPEVIVKVAPQQYDLVLMARTEYLNLMEGQAILTIEADDSLGLADCVLESPSGNVDARLAVQIELIREALEDRLRK